MRPPVRRYDVGEGRVDDFLGVPARRGVVTLYDPEHRPVIVAVTGDLRAFARRRLLDDAVGPAADLRAITASFDITTTGSMLEAELVFLGVARSTMPGVYRAAADRWQAWCLRLDADADPPTWKKHRLGELSASERRRGALLGPIRDKDAAGRLGEAMDDLFDLCRYPVELAKAPSGMACAYHEMGRCPAPCDGSEPMDAYRARVREAIETVCGDLAPERASAEAEMRAAAGRQDFERAARLKARVERLRSIDGFAYKWLGRVERLRVIALLPAERDGWVRVMAIAAGRWRVIADVDAVEGPRGAPGMVDAIVEADRWLHAADTTLTDDACDALGLIAGYLYSKPKLTRGGFVRRTDDTPIGELSPELWSACRSALKAGEPDAEAPDRELGAG